MYLKQWVFIVLSFSLFSFGATHQAKIPDSLRQQLSVAEGSEKADILQELAKSYKYKNPNKALTYARRALAVLDTFPDQTLLAKTYGRVARIYQVTGLFDSSVIYARRFKQTAQQIPDTFLLANAYNYLGIVQKNKGQYFQSIHNIRQYIDYARELGRERHVGMGYNNLGNTYLHLGDYDRALEHYFRFLRISEAQDLKQDGIPTALNNIALVYRDIDSLNKALEYLYRAERVSEQADDRMALSEIYYTLGTVYEQMGHMKSARDYFVRCLEISRDMNRRNAIAGAYLHLGNLHNRTNECRSAKKRYERALNIYNQIEAPDGQVEALYRLGVCYNTWNQTDEALNHLKKALKQARKLGDKTIIRDCARKLHQIYQKMNRPQRALHYYKIHDRFEDSIHSEQSSDNIAKWQIRYRSENKEKRIALLETKHKLQQTRIKRQNLLLWVAIIGGIIAIGAAFLLYRWYRVKKHTNHRLTDQNEKIRSQNREIAKQSQKLEKANKELRQLSVVARETDSLVFLADATGRIEWVNQAVHRVYGKSTDDFIDQDIFSFGLNDNREELKRALFERQESLNYESSFTSPEGEVYYFQTTLTPITNAYNQIERVIAVESDITRIKSIEQDLKNKQAELEQAIASKDKFFSIISHDLKNPFNSLMGLSELLVRKGDQMDPEKIKTFHKSIYTTTRHAYELLSNLLEWSRNQLQRISVYPKTFEMYQLVEQNLSFHQERASEKNIDLVNDLPDQIWVYADYNMITTVLRNLVSNAIKFTGNGGQVKVSHEDETQCWAFHVKDTGVGIAPDQIDRLFELGHSYSSNGTNKEEGTGLGLVLCKEFVSKNGGQMRVNSKPGQGSTFTFTLPKVSADQQ